MVKNHAYSQQTAEPDFHFQEPWYFGKLKGKGQSGMSVAEDLLKQHKGEDGTFLVRESDKCPGIYSISFWYWMLGCFPEKQFQAITMSATNAKECGISSSSLVAAIATTVAASYNTPSPAPIAKFIALQLEFQDAVQKSKAYMYI